MNNFFIKFNQEFVRYKDKEIGAGNIMLMVSTYESYMNKEISKLEAENKKLREASEKYEKIVRCVSGMDINATGTNQLYVNQAREALKEKE